MPNKKSTSIMILLTFVGEYATWNKRTRIYSTVGPRSMYEVRNYNRTQLCRIVCTEKLQNF